METYVFKSVLCLFVLLGFYKIFLEGLKAHRFNRFFLLGSLVFSLVLPAITFTYTVEVPETSVQMDQITAEQLLVENGQNINSETNIEDHIFTVLIGIYGLGFLFFLIRYIKGLEQIYRSYHEGEKQNQAGYILVLIARKLIPHSFFNFIFLNKKDFENSRLSPEVLMHEKAHADQKHSFDLLFVGLVQVLFWFNPLFRILKKSIRLNHEFLADAAVIQQVKDPSEYSDILYKYAGGSHQTGFTSSINHSLTKKRLVMISKTFSRKKMLIRMLILIPVLGCCIFLFNNKIEAKTITMADENSEDLFEYPSGNEFSIQDNSIQKKNPRVIKQDEINNLPKDQTKVVTLMKKTVTEEQMSAWKDPDKYGIWIDGKRIANADLANKKASDFSYYSISKLAANAKNYGKHEFQLDIMTNSYFEDHKIIKRFMIQDNQEDLLKIRIDGDKIWVNGEKTNLKSFAKAIDRETKNLSDEDLKDLSIRIANNGSDKAFMDQLNQEFAKTRLSKVTGFDMLPPPPPAPPKTRENDVPAPPEPPLPLLDKYAQKNILFSMSIKGNTLQIDGKVMKPKNLANTLDKLSEGKTNEELKNHNFRMHRSEVQPDFLSEVNDEFKKSRFAKVTGHEILPPPPPPPSKLQENDVPEPPAPQTGDYIPEPPKHPAPPKKATDMRDRLVEMNARSKEVQERSKNMIAQLEIQQKRLEENKELSDAQKQKINERMQKRQEQFQVRLEQMQKREEEVMQRREELRNEVRERRAKIREERQRDSITNH